MPSWPAPLPAALIPAVTVFYRKSRKELFYVFPAAVCTLSRIKLPEPGNTKAQRKTVNNTLFSAVIYPFLTTSRTGTTLLAAYSGKPLESRKTVGNSVILEAAFDRFPHPVVLFYFTLESTVFRVFPVIPAGNPTKTGSKLTIMSRNS